MCYFLKDDIHMRYLQSRYLLARIHYTRTYRLKFLQQLKSFIAKKIKFIEYDPGRHVVCFSGNQKAVNKAKRGNRACQGDHKKSLIQIGSDDLNGFRQVDGSSDNVVFSGVQVGDNGGRLIR